MKYIFNPFTAILFVVGFGILVATDVIEKKESQRIEFEVPDMPTQVLVFPDTNEQNFMVPSCSEGESQVYVEIQFEGEARRPALLCGKSYQNNL